MKYKENTCVQDPDFMVNSNGEITIEVIEASSQVALGPEHKLKGECLTLENMSREKLYVFADEVDETEKTITFYLIRDNKVTDHKLILTFNEYARLRSVWLEDTTELQREEEEALPQVYCQGDYIE